MNDEEILKMIDEISTPNVVFFKNLRERLLSHKISREDALLELELSDVAKGQQKAQIQPMLQLLKYLYIKDQYELFDKHFDEFFELIFQLEWLKAFEAKLDEIQNENKKR